MTRIAGLRCAVCGIAEIVCIAPGDDKTPVRALCLDHWSIFAEHGEMTVTIRQILEAVAAKLNVTVIDILGHCRTRNIVLARHTAMWLARQLTNKSFPALGRMFSNGTRRNHTSVLAAVRKIDNARIRDAHLCKILSELQEQLEATP